MAARLVERAPGAVLFHTPGAAHGPVVTVETFLRAAHRVAASLPGVEGDNTPVLNLCADRCLFALAFAAAVLRGRPCVLAGADPPGGLARRFAGAWAVAERGGLPAGLEGQKIGLLAADAAGSPPPNPAPAADQLAAFALTSGSTGEPATHPKMWGSLAARSQAAGSRFGLDQARPATVVGTVPPQHMYGFETTVLLPLHAAASSWCGPAFYPADVRAALAAAPAPAILVTTPLQLRALLEAPVLQGGPLPPFAAAISATAPLDLALAARAEQAWGAPVLEIYGATEAGSLASRRTVEGEAWLPYSGVAVVDEDGTAVAIADGVAPQRLADSIEPLGDGRFRLLGRRADLIKLGGRRASLAGLTRILCGLDGVLDGAFAAPDDLEQRASARLLAFAVAPERTAESLLAELRGKVDPLFLPRRVIRVERLPRNGLGKLPREALLALAASAEQAAERR
jgi:acyl-coenzyme A synthetase/AMP-(fatty) acid ligase